MRKTMIALLSAASVVGFTTAASALCTNPAGGVGGAAAGAAAGAAIGGPAGAAVGGVVGGVVGSSALPRTACTYIVEHDVPVAKVEKKIVVGEPLPETVEVYPIPETEKYVFANVNGDRVIVDSGSRTVVEVVN